MGSADRPISVLIAVSAVLAAILVTANHWTGVQTFDHIALTNDTFQLTVSNTTYNLKFPHVSDTICTTTTGCTGGFSTSVTHTFTAKQTFNNTSSKAGFNLQTTTALLTAPKQGDIRIMNNTLRYNDASNNTQILIGNSSDSLVGKIPSRFYGDSISGALGSGAMVANVVRAYPIHLPVNFVAKTINWEIVTGLAGHCRLGIYNTNATMYPTTLISGSDVSEATPNSTAVVTKTFATPITLLGGTYYMVAYTCDVAVTSVRTVSSSAVLPDMGNVGTGGSFQMGAGWTVARTFSGGLPTTYPSGATISTVSASNPPQILLGN